MAHAGHCVLVLDAIPSMGMDLGYEWWEIGPQSQRKALKKYSEPLGILLILLENYSMLLLMKLIGRTKSETCKVVIKAKRDTIKNLKYKTCFVSHGLFTIYFYMWNFIVYLSDDFNIDLQCFFYGVPIRQFSVCRRKLDHPGKTHKGSLHCLVDSQELPHRDS